MTAAHSRKRARGLAVWVFPFVWASLGATCLTAQEQPDLATAYRLFRQNRLE